MLRIQALFAILVVIAVNFAAWYFLNPAIHERPWDGQIQSIAFAPYQADQSPHEKKYPSYDQIDRDMSLVADIAYGIRTYELAPGFDKIPAFAHKYGLTVTAVAIVDGDKSGTGSDQQQMTALIRLAKEYR